MRRVSVRSLMRFILLSAIGLAALRSPSELWAGLMLLLALAALGIAVLGATILRGPERVWWAGFGFFTGGYLILAFAPWLSDSIRPKLGTSQLLSHLYQRMVPSSELTLEGFIDLRTERMKAATKLAQHETLLRENQASQGIRRGSGDALGKRLRDDLVRLDQRLATTPVSFAQFERGGHSWFALVAGLLGATVASWFRRKRDRHDAGAGTVGGGAILDE
jgi:hypothetical protein